MPNRKPRMSLEQHKELGQELAAMYRRLTEIQTMLGQLYPIRPTRGAAQQGRKRIARTRQELTEARNQLDSLMFKEYPEEATPAIYYPTRQE